MLVLKSIPALQNHINKLKSHRNIIGFVPTMGALHEGHLSLIENSIKENDFTIVSIFVNPTQFNDSDDLNSYPSDINSDVKILKLISGKIIIFNPDSQQIYSGDVKSDYFDLEGLDKFMEGKCRGNHFQGVATVVNKLFSMVNPNNVYFGEKDFQQLRIIENLVNQRKLKIRVIRCKTFRAKDGLALSSRNNKLNFSSKKIATNLFKALNFAKENFDTLDIVKIEEKVIELLAEFPQITLDYFSIADEQNLQPTRIKEKNKKYRAFIAADISGIRLIDNIKLY